MFNLFKKRKQITNSGTYDANYWNTKYPQAPIIYSGRTLKTSSSPIKMDVKNFICSNDNVLLDVLKRNRLIKSSFNETALACQKWVTKNIKYVADDTSNKCPEFWQFPFETLASKIGDCVAEYEEIYTKNGIKSVGELKVGDIVLSYDLEKKEYCYKPIIKIWEKGYLPLARTHLRNGQHIDITDNHPLWARSTDFNCNEIKYKKTYLSDIDLTSKWNKKLPIAKKIPYQIIDINWLTEELCIVIGHFLAEGWVEGGHVCSSGYDLIEDIIPLLEENNIPFSESKNRIGVPIIRFLKSDFKDFLKSLKTNSFDIHLPEEMFHLPPNKLEALLNGFWIGDGHNGNYQDKRGFSSNKQECYSTSSEQWAKDIQRIGLQLGRSFHIWKQEKHGGVGKKPIWRITYNTQSHFLKDFGYPDASEVSISFIEHLGKVKMRDFEVADTHTFVFKNGLISHQCEDGGILMASMLINAGIPEWRVKVAAGYVQEAPTAPQGGHAYCIYLADRPESEKKLEWVVLDWCYYEDSSTPVESKPLAKNGGYNGCYKDTWFTFNNVSSWNQTKLEIDGRVK